WAWEVRSVNGKGNDLRLRMPSGCDSLDGPVRKAASGRINRGNLSATLTLDQQKGDAQWRIDEALLDRLIALAESRYSPDNPAIAPAALDGLIAARGVIERSGEDGTDTALDPTQRDAALLAGFEQALEELVAARQAEGARLLAILTDQLVEIEELCAQAANLAALRPEAVKERLQAKLAELLENSAGTPLPEERLAQELALLAVKADVTEELDRLGAHVASARDMLQTGGTLGRKLDFLCQEFNREANTLCSKSQDVALTGIGLSLKTVIDRFREQVQNIE
ncbi:MAG: YicC/YloC family endoribonuclease, partial [Rhodospirillaceae bacterium]